MNEVLDALRAIWHDVFQLHGQTIAYWAGLGAAIIAPALLARIVLGLRRSSRDWAQTQLSAFLHFAMIGLVYPAVLGSILFDVLPDLGRLSLSSTNAPLVALEFAIIAYYCYDYIFVFNRYNQGDQKFHIVEYFTDIFVVVLLYLSATAVQPLTGVANLQEIAGAFFALYVAYVIWDISRGYIRDVLWDGAFAVAYFLFVWQVDLIRGLLDEATPFALAALILGTALYLALLTGRITSSPAKH